MRQLLNVIIFFGPMSDCSFHAQEVIEAAIAGRKGGFRIKQGYTITLKYHVPDNFDMAT